MTIFQCRGPLCPLDHNNIIVKRQEFQVILDDIQDDVREYSYFILESPRQTGKTTLLYQLQHYLRERCERNYEAVYIDFSGLKHQNESELYSEIFTIIQKTAINLQKPVKNLDLINNNKIDDKKFFDLLKQILIENSKLSRLIIMLDETSYIRNDIFSDFFLRFKSFFDKGKSPSDDRYLYQKIIVICTEVPDGIRRKEDKYSNFANTCQRIRLCDFNYDQVFSLAQNLLDFPSDIIEIIASSIYFWAEGHPYLTQRLFQLIDKNHECRNASCTQITEIIKRLVENEFIYDGDANLGHILNCLDRLKEENESYSNSVRQVLNVKPGQSILSIEHEDDLKLIGIIKRLSDRRLVIRNKIYEQKLKLFFGMEDPHPQTKQVYISYSWQKDSNEMANQLVQAFEAKGITIIRDKTHTTYKDPIRNFMQQIGQGKCVVVIISDSYLKSENCMFELVEIARNGNFYDRIFPLVLKDARIYRDLDRIDYLKYWEDEKAKLQAKYKGIDLVKTNNILGTLNLYDEIRRNIDNLTNILKDMNTLNPDLLHESGFQKIIKAVEAKLAGDDQNK